MQKQIKVKGIMSEEKIYLRINNQDVYLDVKKSSEGADAIDITSLYREHGLFTYDPGFMSTASCESAITYIDGEQGILRYRGYDIKELAEKSSFMEVCQLLLYGELPTTEQNNTFIKKITNHTLAHEQAKTLFEGFPRDAHPMSIMVGATASMSAFYEDYLDVDNPDDQELVSLRLIAKMPTIAAMAFKYFKGQPYIYPKNSLNYCENFLHMMFSVPSEDYEIKPCFANALDKLLILHADHEQNASTSTVRLAGSSGANPFVAVGAGIASLWGPAHGGANEAVIKMLMNIGSIDNIPKFIAKAKDKNDPFRMMGFGHRVYKQYDPRAVVLKEACHEVLKSLGITDDPLLEIAMELERIALEDDYFVEKKLYPNVDFYSGILYRTMSIPPEFFTVMFAVARAAGWVAQWKEMMADPRKKIGRPRQLYTGYNKRDFVDIKNR